MPSFINIWRHMSVLVRLLVGFSIALSPLIVGLTWVTTQLSSLRAGLTAAGTSTSPALAGQLADVQGGLWAALIGSVVVGVLLIIVITLALVQPLAALQKASDAIASGDLGVTLDTHWNDEVGRMARSLDAMRDAVAQVVTRIHACAEKVTTASTDLAQGNLDLSQRTEASASHLQQTASAMAQIQAMARQSSEAAKMVAQLSAEAATVAHRGEKALNDGVASMGVLTTSSRKMADIIGVIDGIAFQTNILALNAAVEAARAG